MQIGSFNHISYPAIGTPPVATQSSEDAQEGGQSASVNARGPAVRPTAPAPAAPGVIATIQADSAATNGNALPPGLVYSHGRKSAADDTDADTAHKAEQHRQALERTSGLPASLAVDKDGVLVSKPAAANGSPSQDFVSFAVTAMREYADEQARLKSESGQADSESTSHRIPRSLGDVQKLAARFKLFA